MIKIMKIKNAVMLITFVAGLAHCDSQSMLLLASELNQLERKVQIFSVTSHAKLIVEKGDITECQVDAIVNAANEKLLSGGGVCGAIFAAAGTMELQKACDQVPRTSSGCACPTGEARITPSFKLKDRGIAWIIHAVGPDCKLIKNQNEQDKLLKQAYEKSLELADGKSLASIAFPFVSSAIYAFPKERAAKIAVQTIVGYLRTHATKLHDVHFVLFSDDDYTLFLRIAQQEVV